MEYTITKVFENGKEYPVDIYSGNEIRSITDSVLQLFRPAPNVDYWFEVDHDEKANPYQADSWCSTIYVRCYVATTGGGQRQIPIPKEYTFLNGRKVAIHPDQVGPSPWVDAVEVEFVCL
jgi:hypothetical protein